MSNSNTPSPSPPLTEESDSSAPGTPVTQRLKTKSRSSSSGQQRGGTLVGKFFTKLVNSKTTGTTRGTSGSKSPGPTSSGMATSVEDLVPPVPDDAQDVENRYNSVIKQFGIPHQANMTLENKWRVVWTYERNAVANMEPADDFVADLAAYCKFLEEEDQKRFGPVKFELRFLGGKKDSSTSLSRSSGARGGVTRQIKALDQSISGTLAQRPVPWVNRFVELKGPQFVAEILDYHLLNPRDDTPEMCVDCAKALKILSAVPGGGAVFQDPRTIESLIRSMDYCNMLTRIAILNTLCALVRNHAGFMSVVYALEAVDRSHTTYWMRMINLFDVDNNELRVGVILLLDGLLSHPDDTSFNASASERAIMKGKMVETLYRCDLVNILKALSETSEDLDLLDVINAFRRKHKQFGGSDAKQKKQSSAGQSKAEEEAMIMLLRAFGASGRNAGRLDALQGLCTASQQHHLWAALHFLSEACHQCPADADSYRLLEFALQQTKQTSVGKDISQVYEQRLDKLKADYDELYHKLESAVCLDCGSQNVGQAGSGTAFTKKPGRSGVGGGIGGGDGDGDGDGSGGGGGGGGGGPGGPGGSTDIASGIKQIKLKTVKPPDAAGLPTDNPEDGGAIPEAPIFDGAPPPPPPPPPGGGKRNRGVEPRIKMRGLPWKLVNRVNGTVFDGLALEIPLPLDELELLFAAVPVAKKEQAVNDGKPREILLLETKRSDNVCIMLTKFRDLPFSQIRQAIVACDTAVFPMEKLVLMQPFVPTEEELRVLAPYSGDRRMLGKAERFFLELAEVPRLAQRFHCLIYKGQFSDRFDAVDSTVSNLLHALQALRDSENFRRMLAIILAVGNYLNGGTFRGGAEGFTLSQISDLLTFKTNTGGVMMDFLVKYVRTNYPDVMGWAKEVEIVTQVSGVNMNQVGVEVAAVAEGFQRVQAEMEVCDEVLKNTMSGFVTEATPMITKLQKNFQKARAEYDALCRFFGEDPVPPSEDFLSTLDAFVRSFINTERRLRLLDEKKKRNEEKGKLQGQQVAVVQEIKRRASMSAPEEPRLDEINSVLGEEVHSDMNDLRNALIASAEAAQRAEQGLAGLDN